MRSAASGCKNLEAALHCEHWVLFESLQTASLRRPPSARQSLSRGYESLHSELGVAALVDRSCRGLVSWAGKSRKLGSTPGCPAQPHAAGAAWLHGSPAPPGLCAGAASWQPPPSAAAPSRLHARRGASASDRQLRPGISGLSWSAWIEHMIQRASILSPVCCLGMATAT